MPNINKESRIRSQILTILLLIQYNQKIFQVFLSLHDQNTSNIFNALYKTLNMIITDQLQP